MSQVFTIQKTKKTPYVNFDKLKAKLEIVGNSVLEDSQTFYVPVIEEVENYIKEPQDSIEIDLKIGYLCTGSSKFIFQIISKFKEIHKSGKGVQINWYFIEDDIDMYDMGKAFQEITALPISFHPLSE